MNLIPTAAVQVRVLFTYAYHTKEKLRDSAGAMLVINPESLKKFATCRARS